MQDGKECRRGAAWVQVRASNARQQGCGCEHEAENFVLLLTATVTNFHTLSGLTPHMYVWAE